MVQQVPGGKTEGQEEQDRADDLCCQVKSTIVMRGIFDDEIGMEFIGHVDGQDGSADELDHRQDQPTVQAESCIPRQSAASSGGSGAVW